MGNEINNSDTTVNSAVVEPVNNNEQKTKTLYSKVFKAIVCIMSFIHIVIYVLYEKVYLKVIVQLRDAISALLLEDFHCSRRIKSIIDDNNDNNAHTVSTSIAQKEIIVKNIFFCESKQDFYDFV